MLQDPTIVYDIGFTFTCLDLFQFDTEIAFIKK